MAFRRKKKNHGTISIGASNVPTIIDETAQEEMLKRDEIEKDTLGKVKKYRKDNPEEPVAEKKRLDAPLKIKRNHISLDNEYIELAKRYIGLPQDANPTVVELSKGVIRLFEDNAKMYTKLQKLQQQCNSINASPLHSWQHDNSWN